MAMEIHLMLVWSALLKQQQKLWPNWGINGNIPLNLVKKFYGCCKNEVIQFKRCYSQKCISQVFQYVRIECLFLLCMRLTHPFYVNLGRNIFGRWNYIIFRLSRRKSVSSQKFTKKNQELPFFVNIFCHQKLHIYKIISVVLNKA